MEKQLSELYAVAALAIPALGVVAADPLISLIDTACIGRVSTQQLAALAPNGAVFNMIFQVRLLSSLRVSVRAISLLFNGMRLQAMQHAML